MMQSLLALPCRLATLKTKTTKTSPRPMSKDVKEGGITPSCKAPFADPSLLFVLHPLQLPRPRSKGMISTAIVYAGFAYVPVPSPSVQQNIFHDEVHAIIAESGVGGSIEENNFQRNRVGSVARRGTNRL